MKRFLTTTVSVLLVLGGLGYVFKSQLFDVFADQITADMYVAEDADNFDPGLAIGDQMPPIRALFQGKEINALDQFVHDKGMIFMANRSASW